MNENILEIQRVFDAGAAICEPKDLELDPSRPQAIVIPSGYKVEYPPLEKLQAMLPKPVRARGEFVFGDVDSFCRYVKEHGNDDTRIFVDVTDRAAMYLAILNFHSASNTSWNDHIAIVHLEPTHEWTVWTDHDGKNLPQGIFAEFLEENASLFEEPTGAKLLELVTNLEGCVKADFKSALKLHSGEVKFEYDETVALTNSSAGTRSGTIQVPKKLMARFAPFEGTVPYRMEARLKYRMESRKLSFFYESVDPHLVVKTVVQDVNKAIERHTKQVPMRMRKGSLLNPTCGKTQEPGGMEESWNKRR